MKTRTELEICHVNVLQLVLDHSYDILLRKKRSVFRIGNYVIMIIVNIFSSIFVKIDSTEQIDITFMLA